MPRRATLPYLVLFAGVLIASTASIMIRLAQGYGVPSLTIAAGRMALAALILTPLAWARVGGELRQIGRRDLLLGLAAGAFLALHFASWISSLAYTSVASSAALVASNPLWVGLATLLVFRERLPLAALAGIALSIAGSALIALSDSAGSSGSNPLLGDALALLGAITVSGYFLIGRALRRRLSVLAYIWLVYSSAAVLLLIATLVGRQQVLGFPPPVYALLLLLAVGPQLLGHTAFNWALKYLSATFIAVSILGEPLGSALLALLVFGERFAPLQLFGFMLLLVGIATAALGEGRAPVASQRRSGAEGL